ncbi:craniofacial development protein 2-like [Condylostylus longicornis]|uniref:craniofacial development protein 2-like n=1 Tax=Condylostylus longicornis TaxID=2530218 RepID=UPI00244E0CBE|nr:craniofacial development protein 2-like [Condylostylus longicornis]
MKRLQIDILGISETFWPNSGQCQNEGAKIFYSGNDDKRHRKGVGIIVSKNFSNSVSDFIPYSDRTMLLRFDTKPIKLNVIQAYAPTADASEEEIEAFYAEITDLLKITKPHELNIIMGDFNAKIGRGESNEVIGKFGLGTRNDRGDRLVQFCQEIKFKVTNTWFHLPPRRLYTWASPQDNDMHIVRNQIDFILINKRFSTSVSKVSTYPGADVPSDHNLLLAKIKIKLASIRRSQRSFKLDLDKLNIDEVRSNISKEINDQLRSLQTNNATPSWQQTSSILKSVARNKLGTKKFKAKQKWITDEILNLMKERRRYRNNNRIQYNRLHNLIRSKIRKAKADWLDRECSEIERLQHLHDDFGVHKKIKLASRIHRKKAPSMLIDNQDQVITEPEDKKNTWKNYINQLFSDTRSNSTRNSTIQLSGPPITKAEILKAISSSKDNKAVGPDELPAEIIKIIDEDNINILRTG